jgi:hypothetical protein
MNTAERQIPQAGDLALDHVAHFVDDLDEAAAVYESVGMKVSPLSIHKIDGRPSGTSNRCVMFERGYVELLAGAGAEGKGLRLACFGTPDAEAEHRRLVTHGFEPLPFVRLSRRIGRSLARFGVVRTFSMPEGRVQYCQHLTPQLLWTKSLVNPVRMDRWFVVADDPAATAARWARFAGMLPRPGKDGIRLETARGTVVIARRFPWPTPAGPALAGYGLAVRRPQAFLARCRKAGLQVKSRIVHLPAALGGAWVIS